MLCSKCRFDNPESFAFCGRCGSPIVLSTRSEGAGGAEGHYLPSPERRQLTVMFFATWLDRRRSRSADPEELGDLTQEYQKVCAEIVDHYEGRIAQFLGDGLLVTSAIRFPTRMMRSERFARDSGLLTRFHASPLVMVMP